MKRTLHISVFLFSVLCAFSCVPGDQSVADTGAADIIKATSDGVLFTIDASASKIYWEGYKLGTTHTGMINVADGSIVTQNGNITGGSTTIDMTSIAVTDLEGGSKERLENHLKGTTAGKETDFFNVARYPAARFEITGTSQLANDPDANALIYGNLQIMDSVKNIGFRAQVTITDDKVVATTPLFKIDRTEWGIKHRSGKFFADLGDRVISDEIGLRLELVAAPADQSEL